MYHHNFWHIINSVNNMRTIGMHRSDAAATTVTLLHLPSLPFSRLARHKIALCLDNVVFVAILVENLHKDRNARARIVGGRS